MRYRSYIFSLILKLYLLIALVILGSYYSEPFPFFRIVIRLLPDEHKSNTFL